MEEKLTLFTTREIVNRIKAKLPKKEQIVVANNSVIGTSDFL